MGKFFSLSLLICVVFFACSKGNYVYKSPNRLDWVRIAKAKKQERGGGLRHPYDFDSRQMREILSSLRFNKKFLIQRDIEEQQLFQERHVEYLLPYLLQAFRRVGPEEVVSVSFFTQSRKYGLANDRLTIFRAYLQEDGLHLQFQKIYAKLIGDRTTQGSLQATQEARGIGVTLELQPGQNRISWDPEEIVFDLNVFTKNGIRNNVKNTAGPKFSNPKPEKVPPKTLDARDRLKELERLRQEELITEKEYEKKRKEILKDL
ncbi:MAG: hypothetical protein HYT77_03135 [Deltaproteobacteria bacterium]|nr:hypothetical protein [Deltaproteobacteria bacterium]